jgi:hypothetical protein
MTNKTNEIVLIADTELLGLMRDQVTIPDCVTEEQRDDLGITLLRVTTPMKQGAKFALRDLREQLETLGVLAEQRWLSAVEADHLLRRYEPVVWCYLVVKDDDQVGSYLGFGAAFAGPALGKYRIVRTPETHLDWQYGRLATGLQLGCPSVFDTYADAVEAAEALAVQRIHRCVLAGLRGLRRRQARRSLHRSWVPVSLFSSKAAPVHHVTLHDAGWSGPSCNVT